MRLSSAAVIVTPFLFVLAAVAADTPKPPPPALPAPGAAAPAAADPSKAEGRFKNIQALKGYPADAVFPAMQFISASLGVDCGYCHVDREPEKDDKKEKGIARKMITMTLAINHDNFDGHLEVTCMSCHRGATDPVSVPVIAAGEPKEEPAAEKPADLPTVSAVLDKYVQAVGGAEALAKITTRTQKGKIIGFSDNPLPVTVMTKAPDKRATIVQNPKGENITAFDGQHGWMFNTGRPARDMNPVESEAARLDAMVIFPSDFKSLFTDLKVVSFDTIDGKQAVKVRARSEGKPPVVFWFDAQSGLIVRMMRYAETPIGRNPTEIDYGDYRAESGVKIPFRWTVGRPSGSFTIQLEESKSNAPVDDKVFLKPAPPA
jgi:photosynthetic reaction center cytochrome c subunit